MIPVTERISIQLIQQRTENSKYCTTAFPNQACPVLSSTLDGACRVMMAWPSSTWPGSDLSIKLRSSCSLRQSVSHRFHQHRWRPQSFQLSGFISPTFCHSYCSQVCFEATFLSWMAEYVGSQQILPHYSECLTMLMLHATSMKKKHF